MFIHHPDGYFVIDGQRVPEAVFRRFAPGYALPAGFVGRVYEPGVKHYLTRADGTALPLRLDWAEGEEYIAAAGRIGRAAKRHEQKRIEGIPAKGPVIQQKVRTYDRQQQKRVLGRTGGSGGRDADRAG